jgi:hypothetical protein
MIVRRLRRLLRGGGGERESPACAAGCLENDYRIRSSTVPPEVEKAISDERAFGDEVAGGER